MKKLITVPERFSSTSVVHKQAVTDKTSYTGSMNIKP